MHKAAEDFARFYEEITADGIHPHNIEMAYWAMVGHEKALKSCMLQEQLEDGHSGNRGRYTVRGDYSGRMPDRYEDGDSYRRRDARGRYTRDGEYSGAYDGDDYSGRHYVRGHYSREDGRGYMMEQMHRDMERYTPEERKAIERFMRNLEKD